ncbi:MAG: FAD-dependent oxidoreductase, partial [Elusimicrobia bacterium]|nr:FAD-dependent oxidoreductase [Elusimicrobiota bacterium]
SDEALGEKIVADLEKLFPGSRSKVHGMRILRWGHAMPINFPGYLTQVRPRVAKPLGRIFFAGVDTDMPSIEGAIVSGARAADEAVRFLGRPISN